MEKFWQGNKNFLAIIIGAVIIGIFIYSGIKDRGQNQDVVYVPASISAKNAEITPAASSIMCGADENTIVTKVSGK